MLIHTRGLQRKKQLQRSARVKDIAFNAGASSLSVNNSTVQTKTTKTHTPIGVYTTVTDTVARELSRYNFSNDAAMQFTLVVSAYRELAALAVFNIAEATYGMVVDINDYSDAEAVLNVRGKWNGGGSNIVVPWSRYAAGKLALNLTWASGNSWTVAGYVNGSYVSSTFGADPAFTPTSVTCGAGLILGHFAKSAPLPNTKLLSLSANPWQIFEPSTRRVFIGSSGTPVSNSAIANIEALQAVAKQCQYSIESLGRAAQTYTVLIESLARVAQSAVVNIESLSRVDKQAAQNIEALAAINKAGVPNIESLATVNKSGSANIESLLSTSQARSQNVESLGGVFSPRVINIEALGGIEVAKAAIISIEALGFINKQSVLGIEALSRLAVSASITFESLLTTTKQGAANIEALAAVVVLRVQNIEAKQSVTKLSVFSFETLAGISKLFDVPIEALQGAVINIITNTVDKTVTFTLTLSKGAKFTTTLPKTIKF